MQYLLRNRTTIAYTRRPHKSILKRKQRVDVIPEEDEDMPTEEPLQPDRQTSTTNGLDTITSASEEDQAQPIANDRPPKQNETSSGIHNLNTGGTETEDATDGPEPEILFRKSVEPRGCQNAFERPKPQMKHAKYKFIRIFGGMLISAMILSIVVAPLIYRTGVKKDLVRYLYYPPPKTGGHRLKDTVIIQVQLGH